MSDIDKHKIFDFRYNEDYRDQGTMSTEEVDLMRRGGVLYREPEGWKRYSIRVAGKYDDGDDTWLHNWAVAFHGCPMTAVPLIMEQGFKHGVSRVRKTDRTSVMAESSEKGSIARPTLR